MVDSLRYLSSRKAATALVLTKADLSRLPLDVHDDLRRHLSKVIQIKLWDGEYKCWHDNGQLRIHGWYNRYCQLCGECTIWYKNGQLCEHGWYNKNGEQDGEYKYWDPDGQLVIHAIYKNGLPEYQGCRPSW